MLVRIPDKGSVYVTAKQAAKIIENLATQLALSVDTEVELSLPNRPSVNLSPKNAAKVIADLAKQLGNEQVPVSGPAIDKETVKKALHEAFPVVNDYGIASRAGKLWYAMCRIADNRVDRDSFMAQEILDLKDAVISVPHKGVGDGIKDDYRVLYAYILNPHPPKG